MEPIVLNEFGETLIWKATSLQLNDRSFLGRSALGSFIGTHDCCYGQMHIQEISKTIFAILCERCYLRIVIPKEINSYGRLRQWCAQEIRNREDERVRLEVLWRDRVAKIPKDIEEYRESDAKKGLTPESAEIVRAADEDRRRIRKIIGNR